MRGEIALSGLRAGAAVVTGATSGLGAALAAELARAGLDLVLVGRDNTRLSGLAGRLAAEHGIAALPCVRDLADPRDLEGLGTAVAALAGRPLSVVVHCAAADDGLPLHQAEAGRAAGTLGVNLIAPWLIAARALADMERLRQGQIVLVSSNLAVAALPDSAAYAIGKAGLERLADALMAERRSRGIDVLVVVPGQLASPLRDAGLARQPAWLRALLPRPAEPAAVARAIVRRGFGRSGTLVLAPGHRLFRLLLRLAPQTARSLLSLAYRNRADTRHG
jgi:short-subunit dehydrogenase